MPKRVLLGLLLACGLAAPVLAQEPKTGGVINAVIQPEPPGLMLAMTQNGPTQMVSSNIFEGLLRYSPKLEPQPQLAESWSVSEDAKTYTFKLRKGVTWHDGKPFTSADVKFSLEEVWKKLHPRGRVTFAKVTAVDTPDANTVVIHLSDPTPMMLSAFSSYESQVLPKHVYEGKDFTT